MTSHHWQNWKTVYSDSKQHYQQIAAPFFRRTFTRKNLHGKMAVLISATQLPFSSNLVAVVFFLQFFGRWRWDGLPRNVVQLNFTRKLCPP